jgi:FtsH-binding integral membrane protein
MTFAMVVGLTTYAWTSLQNDAGKSDTDKNNTNALDLTKFGPYIHTTFFLVAAMAIIMLVAGDKLGNKMQMMYIYCAVMVFSLYLMFDIQVIVGGKTAMYHHDIESYALGAMSIYIDIIQIGALLCQAFGSD